MNNLTASSLTSASRNTSGASSSIAASSKGILAVVTVTAIDAATVFGVSITNALGATLAGPITIDRVGTHVLACGAGLSSAYPPRAIAQVTDAVSSGFKSRANVTPPTNHRIDYTISGGNVTFKVDYAKN